MRWIGLVALLAITDVSAGPQPKTQITIWASPIGGLTYGIAVPGAMIFEQREVEVAPNGEVRVDNVAGTADPISMQVRDLTDPNATITEQRFIPAAKSATELMARRVGERVTVVTSKGEIGGVLRSVDDRNLVVETGSGDARGVSVMRREHAVDVRFSGAAFDRPGVAWKLVTTKPGKHSVELTYRADGLSWAPAYVAVLDEPGKLVDFTALATVKNATGATFDNASLILMSGQPSLAGPTPLRSPATPLRSPATPLRSSAERFAIPQAVKLTGDAVQLELLRVGGAKVRQVAVWEAMPDPSSEVTDSPNTECLANNSASGGTSDAALEIDLPVQSTLPEGPVRLFRRRGQRLEAVTDDQLRSAAGVARVKMSSDSAITGDRNALSCTVDERAHTIHERIELRVENKSAAPVDVIAREFLWRWAVWRVENESKKGVRTGPQTIEYRLRLAPKSSQTLTYTAVYTW